MNWRACCVQLKYSFSFQTNNPNVHFNIRDSKMAVFSDKISSLMTTTSLSAVEMIISCLKISIIGKLLVEILLTLFNTHH